MDVRVVLVEPEYEVNIGSIARAMKNFGLNELWLANPRVELGAEARRYAAHAQDVMGEIVVAESLDAALEGITSVVGTTATYAKRSANLKRTAITPAEFAKQAASSGGKVALLFGRESTGLTNDELNRCDFVVTIPASDEYGVLNVAVASAIVFYELFKAQNGARVRGYAEEADHDTKKRLVDLFDHLSLKAGLPAHKRRLAKRAFHNVISRAFVSKREATLIVGVFRRAAQTRRI